MITTTPTDAERAQAAVDLIADALGLPIADAEPVHELAERCVTAVREIDRKLDAAQVAAQFWQGRSGVGTRRP